MRKEKLLAWLKVVKRWNALKNTQFSVTVDLISNILSVNIYCKISYTCVNINSNIFKTQCSVTYKNKNQRLCISVTQHHSFYDDYSIYHFKIDSLMNAFHHFSAVPFLFANSIAIEIVCITHLVASCPRNSMNIIAKNVLCWISRFLVRLTEWHTHTHTHWCHGEKRNTVVEKEDASNSRRKEMVKNKPL